MAVEHACTGRFRKDRDLVRGLAVSDYQTVFGPWLDGLGLTGPHSGGSPYDRVRTFWLFLSQMFSSDGSCQEVVCRAAAWHLAECNEVLSMSTSAYCQARARLPLEFLEGVSRHVVTQIQERFGDCWLWHGRHAKVVDGTTGSMPDTPENQEAWPQPDGQKPGVGFPMMRMVGLFCMATGSLLDVACGTLRDSEKVLWPRLWHRLDPGDVLLADRGFCSFANMWLLLQRGVDSLIRLNEHRSTGVINKRRLGRRDWLVDWVRSGPCPKWLEPEIWREMPERMTLRHVTFTVPIRGFRTQTITIATTLLDPVEFPACDLAELFRRRWTVELFLRDLKISMGMDVLRCKTPQMIEREVQMHLIAYNLIRAVMAEAAASYPIEPTRLSFKAAMQLLRQCHGLGPQPSADVSEDRREVLLFWIASKAIPHRPNRIEPRARKRRPKNYQLLTLPRRQFREIAHRNRYVARQAQ